MKNKKNKIKINLLDVIRVASAGPTLSAAKEWRNILIFPSVCRRLRRRRILKNQLVLVRFDLMFSVSVL